MSVTSPPYKTRTVITGEGMQVIKWLQLFWRVHAATVHQHGPRCSLRSARKRRGHRSSCSPAATQRRLSGPCVCKSTALRNNHCCSARLSENPRASTLPVASLKYRCIPYQATSVYGDGGNVSATVNGSVEFDGYTQFLVVVSPTESRCSSSSSCPPDVLCSPHIDRHACACHAADQGGSANSARHSTLHPTRLGCMQVHDERGRFRGTHRERQQLQLELDCRPHGQPILGGLGASRSKAAAKRP